MTPLDLTARPPRSCYEELDGLMLLPRTIDKMRALLPGGKPGVYLINAHIVGISGYLLSRLGVSEDEFREAVAAAHDDTEVAAWLRTRTDASKYAEINAALRKIRRKHVEDQAFFNRMYADVLAADPQLEYIFDIVDADDRLMFGRA
ncbi:MAG TPA: DUF5069 domain-containing protein [Candidatus Aquilonibacter sp.]|nr:DUF5069 domain-containing protein [Candidatus Aquilonibacter sp.]